MTDTLDTHPSADIIKLLLIGESGTGKTGALASLALSGYILWILDFDNGLDILANILRPHPEAMARVHYKSLRDKVSISGGVPKIQPPVSAWKPGKTLKEWGVENFTSQDIIVLDTLTSASQAAFNEALSIAGRLNQRPQQNDYGWMADSVLLFIDALTSEDAKYNVIVSTHIRFFAGDDDTQTSARGLPNAKGQQISKDIAKYFNTVLLTRTQGTGPAARRILSTQPQGVVEVKTSAPKNVKSTYPIETGLAQLFEDILGHTPNQKEPKPNA